MCSDQLVSAQVHSANVLTYILERVQGVIIVDNVHSSPNRTPPPKKKRVAYTQKYCEKWKSDAKFKNFASLYHSQMTPTGTVLLRIRVSIIVFSRILVLNNY